MLADIEPGDTEAEERDLLAEPMQFTSASRAARWVDRLSPMRSSNSATVAVSARTPSHPRPRIEQPLRSLGFSTLDQPGPHPGQSQRYGS